MRKVFDKKEYMFNYVRTPAGKKAQRIGKWRYRGIKVIDDDFNKFYDSYLSTTNCELCNKELTIDKQNTHSTRCVDHDHLINDRPNVRAVCCNACNQNNKLTNTSGEPNISYNKINKNWYFKKMIQGKKYTKAGFNTIEEAIEYKNNFLSTL